MWQVSHRFSRDDVITGLTLCHNQGLNVDMIETSADKMIIIQSQECFKTQTVLNLKPSTISSLLRAGLQAPNENAFVKQD